jgi:drug/metabolite transporter (DMT)-like permease
MSAAPRIHVKTLVLITLMAFFGPMGDVLLRKGMKRIGVVTSGPPAALLNVFFRIFSSGTIWLGIGSLALFFLFYMLVLSWADYSYVQPASAVGYAVVALLGYFMLGETVTAVRWAGVAVICAGVLLVGQTPARTTEIG